MTVCKRARGANSNLKDTHYQVAVDLGENNPHNLKTYILVKRSRHTLFPDANGPPQSSLTRTVRSPFFRSAYKFVQEAYKKGLLREDANAKLSETIKKCVGVGWATLLVRFPPSISILNLQWLSKMCPKQWLLLYQRGIRSGWQSQQQTSKRRRVGVACIVIDFCKHKNINPILLSKMCHWNLHPALCHNH